MNSKSTILALGTMAVAALGLYIASQGGSEQMFIGENLSPLPDKLDEQSPPDGNQAMNSEVNSEVNTVAESSSQLEHETAVEPAADAMNTAPEDMNSGMDDIGGYYDPDAMSPESEVQQVGEIGPIGVDAPDALAPEAGYENMPAGEAPEASTNVVPGNPPEIDNKKGHSKKDRSGP